jgi:basic amino acid/polyamine antiporter, APA family
MPRKFTTPLPWVVGILGILGCAYLFWSLPVRTQTYFLIWNAFGIILYMVYGSSRAERARAAA